MVRGVLGTASWRIQQVFPQFGVDVSLLWSATAHPVVQDLLDANKLVRDMHRRCCTAPSFSLVQWTPIAATGFEFLGGDASDRPRPDDSQTRGYVITLATEKSSGKVKKKMMSA